MKLNNLKAGMEKVDVRKVEKVLNSAEAKTSPFYKHQELMDAKAQKRNDELAQRAVEARKNQRMLLQWQNEADAEVAQYPLTDLSASYLHMDMDAFFANVEIRDNPAYASLPLAVGSTSMISTSNYVARRFGVRAGMAGFMALKICPDLIIVPCRHHKYAEIGAEIREKVLTNYDPNYRSFSCDEATLNITNYCEKHCVTPSEVGRRIKDEVVTLTGLTCSVGIGPHPILSKIAAEFKKPDGLFAMHFTSQDELRDFLFPIGVRKIPFLGRRTEDLLKEIGIINLGDIYHERGLLWGLLPRKTAMSYILCPYGIFHGSSAEPKGETGEKRALDGSTSHKPVASEHSISKERTFGSLRSKEELMGIFKRVMGDVLVYYESYQDDHVVTSVTLKLKSSSFAIRQRSMRLPTPTKTPDVLAETALRVLASENFPIDIRLLGIKLTLQAEEAEDEPRTIARKPVPQGKRIDSYFKAKSAPKELVVQKPHKHREFIIIE